MPIYVKVTPTITPDEDTVIDASVLQQLGSPTVDITGTLDGQSSLVVASASITPDKLATEADQTVLGNGSGAIASPVPLVLEASVLQATSTALNVATGGIGTAKLANNAVTTVKITDANVTLPKIQALAPRSLIGNNQNGSVAPVEILYGNSGGLISSLASSGATSQRARNGINIATLTTAIAHGLKVGEFVNITGFAGGASSWNATRAQVLSVPTSTTFTYYSVGTSTLTTADATGTVARVPSIRTHDYFEATVPTFGSPTLITHGITDANGAAINPSNVRLSIKNISAGTLGSGVGGIIWYSGHEIPIENFYVINGINFGAGDSGVITAPAFTVITGPTTVQVGVHTQVYSGLTAPFHVYWMSQQMDPFTNMQLIARIS